jgi:cyclohexanecarboxylate-CoA ligase
VQRLPRDSQLSTLDSHLPLGLAFAHTCATHAAKLALIDGPTRLTFTDLDRLSARLAHHLRALGITSGDTVAYQLPNWWETVVVFLATARLGAIANPLLPIFRERELGFILAQAQPKIVFVPGRFRGMDYRDLIAGVRSHVDALAHVVVVRDEAREGMTTLAHALADDRGRTALPPPAIDPSSLALLMYTSGTTADPKGVLHSHRSLSAEIDSLGRVHQLTPADVTLMPSPLTHISGLIHATLAPALLGSAAVLMERWEASAAIQLIEAERVTYMVGAPTFVQDLIDAQQRHQRDLSSFRLFSCGGADVSANLMRRARSVLGCVAKRVYGSTEFPTITTTDAGDADTMGIETEGRVIAPSELRIVDDAGAACPTGIAGEVQARGPECCVGYRDAMLNRDAFTTDGWFRTGDLGVVDDAGYLRITGRLKEIVIRKGEKLSVREIEEAIARHPAVAEVAVLAVADTATGERACAVVVLRPGHRINLEELSAFLDHHGLARQKHPEQLIVRADLPRTDSGKIHRAALKAALATRVREA